MSAEPESRAARTTAWVLGIFAGIAVLAAFLFWLGIQLGYIEVISKLSSGSSAEPPTSAH
jgi:hypothetical protein